MNKFDYELRQRNRRLKAWLRRRRDWARATIPTGIRSVVGLILVGGGVLGFLPILGFWMIPLGLLFIALDLAAIWRLIATALRRRSTGAERSGQTADDGSDQNE